MLVTGVFLLKRREYDVLFAKTWLPGMSIDHYMEKTVLPLMKSGPQLASETGAHVKKSSEGAELLVHRGVGNVIYGITGTDELLLDRLLVHFLQVLSEVYKRAPSESDAIGAEVGKLDAILTELINPYTSISLHKYDMLKRLSKSKGFEDV